MFIPDFFTQLAMINAENPNLFPFPFKLHLGFCIVAFIFFILRFTFDKKPYQAILAVAIPFSMTLHLSENKVWFYIVGIIELLLLISAFITSVVWKKKHPQPVDKKAEESAENIEESTEESGE